MKIITAQNLNINLERFDEKQKKVYALLLNFFEGIEDGYKECEISGKLKENVEGVKYYLAPFSTISYEITIFVSKDKVLVELSGWHEQFNYPELSSMDDFLKELRNFLSFIMSSYCKLLIFNSNNKSYKWNLVHAKENRLISSTALIFYNFFGKRNIQEKKAVLVKDIKPQSVNALFEKYV